MFQIPIILVAYNLYGGLPSFKIKNDAVQVFAISDYFEPG